FVLHCVPPLSSVHFCFQRKKDTPWEVSFLYYTYLQNHIQNVFLHPFNPALLSLLRKRIPRNLRFLGTFAPQSFRPSPHDSEPSVPLHGPDGLPVFSALWISLRPISNSQ